MLKLVNLQASIDGVAILKGVTLTINAGEIHAIMGRNGAGKSTLAKVIAGDPAYDVTADCFEFCGKDIRELEPQDRAYLGLFMSFQYPVEIPGVSNVEFLRTAYNAHRAAHEEQAREEEEFGALVEKTMNAMEIPLALKDRSLNEGFSGGEKKRNEILQMAMLKPQLAVLDETDSGLDIDALRIVAKGVNTLQNKNNALLLITHYQRLLNYIQPTYVHVMVGGRIVRSGGPELALQLEEKGYDWLSNETTAKGVS